MNGEGAYDISPWTEALLVTEGFWERKSISLFQGCKPWEIVHVPADLPMQIVEALLDLSGFKKNMWSLEGKMVVGGAYGRSWGSENKSELD